MHTPLVSVIIPAHNRSRMLAQALSSLAQQTYSDFVVVICDDASTEDLREEVGRFDELNIEFHRFEQNGGAQVNHQRGADLCKTRYGILLNSDDLLLRNALKVMSEALEDNPNAAACLGGSVEFRESPQGGIQVIKESLPASLPATTRGGWLQIRELSCFSPSQTLLRMDAFRQVGGYNPGCRTIYDWELLLALRSKYGVVALQEVTTAYRHHDEQLVGQNDVATGALSSRDTLFVTSAENPLRARIQMPRLQQMFLRQWVGWNLIRQSFSSKRPVANLLHVIRLLAGEGVLVPLTVCAPFWFLIFFATRPNGQARVGISREQRASYTALLAGLMRRP